MTVLLVAVSEVRVFTSHRKIDLSNPALATNSRSLAYARHLVKGSNKGEEAEERGEGE